MLNGVKRAVGAALGRQRRRTYDRELALLCRSEFEHQEFDRFNERPVEYAFVFKALADYYPKSVLDVGTGTTALPHLMRSCGCLVTAIDNVRDYWPAGMSNRHYHVVDDDITDTRIGGLFDLITCVSVIEHIRDAEAAVSNMLSLLGPGGHLVLTCPYSEQDYVENVYELPGSSYGQDFAFTTQSFSRNEVDRWLDTNDAELVEQEYWRFWTGNHWTVGEQLIPPLKVTADESHQLSCMLIRRRQDLV